MKLHYCLPILILFAPTGRGATIQAGYFQELLTVGGPQYQVNRNASGLLPDLYSIVTRDLDKVVSPLFRYTWNLRSELAAKALGPNSFSGYNDAEASLFKFGADNLAIGPYARGSWIIYSEDILSFRSTFPGKVDFELVSVLASTWAFGGPQDCTTPGNLASSTVSFNILGAVGNFLSSQVHDTCGKGRNYMVSRSLFSVRPGEVFPISAYFSMYAKAATQPDIPFPSYGYAFGDATAHFWVNVLTPGATLTSASGASYAAAPEPATATSMSLMLLLGIILVRRNCRGRRMFN